MSAVDPQPFPPRPRDVREILTEEQIARLRAGYDREAMNRAAIGALISPFPPSRAFAEFVVGHFFDPQRWPPDRRELCLITYFTADGADATNLGTHIYWGLMEGLTPDVIGDTILLAAAYSGIDNYTNGINVLRHVLLVLRDILEGPDPDRACQCMSVIPRLRG
ncbi:MAG: hypothetical protein IT372_04350 [Polyangiaceae bacterium]|nr:hypothetical protein [Polyangiaceae bacterium]